jgi:hypothetical protein
MVLYVPRAMSGYGSRKATTDNKYILVLLSFAKELISLRAAGEFFWLLKSSMLVDADFVEPHQYGSGSEML